MNSVILVFTGWDSKNPAKTPFEMEMLGVFKNVEFCHANDDPKKIYARIKNGKGRPDIHVILHSSCSRKNREDRRKEASKEFLGYKVDFSVDYNPEDYIPKAAKKYGSCSNLKVKLGIAA